MNWSPQKHISAHHLRDIRTYHQVDQPEVYVFLSVIITAYLSTFCLQDIRTYHQVDQREVYVSLSVIIIAYLSTFCLRDINTNHQFDQKFTWSPPWRHWRIGTVISICLRVILAGIRLLLILWLWSKIQLVTNCYFDLNFTNTSHSGHINNCY